MTRLWLKGALVALLAGLLLLWVLMVIKPEQHATMSYKITSSLNHVSLDDIEDVIWPFLAQGFWEVDLPGLQYSLQQQTWVKQAHVSRQWPNQLILELEERDPIARWGQAGLIDRQGEVFNPENVAAFEHLVKLTAHDLQTRAMLRHWHQVQDTLNQMAWRVKSLTWFADDVLHVEVDAGHQLYIIASEKGLLLQRFIQAWPHLDTTELVAAKTLQMPTKEPVKWKIDLRYSNGMALKPLTRVD
ncbi:cell division protein FtsQ/DivIB [Thiomicrospira sp. ALE5]|uniref:cell division protein FtsQ/DivIB n=1 Tax=Thiomicrospira sp. ALE5 TaxID=748650 RepID=UPI0008DF50E2|nr:FtsQ-type POTRA domain-containing protein [Thiomicrospira sp. ALE5]SFR62918.1 cell division protein FtsQ [Thiomicrospira sp. ALE5]